MFSKTNTSTEFDNVDIIISDLVAGLEGTDPNHTIGLLVCDSQIDYADIVSRLSGILNFPFAGGTTLAFPISNPGGDELSASFAVFGGSNMQFSVCSSAPLNQKIHTAQVEEIFNKCMENLGGEPKLIIPFFPLVPGLMTDYFINDLFTFAAGVPVFGGTVTDDLVESKSAVFANGQCFHNSMVLIAIAGDIKPVFAVGSQVSCMSEYGPVVTNSKGNVVYSVDNTSFCEYMSSLGVPPENRVNGLDAMLQYGPLPVQLRNKREEDDGIREIRCISYTNVEDGSVTFSSNLPEGTRVNVGILQKDDVVDSASGCIEYINKKVTQQSADGYKFSTMLYITCVARYFSLAGGENHEKKLLSSKLNSQIPSIGYYGFAEIGPVYRKDGKGFTNRSHNASIIMCAF